MPNDRTSGMIPNTTVSTDALLTALDEESVARESSF